MGWAGRSARSAREGAGIEGEFACGVEGKVVKSGLEEGRDGGSSDHGGVVGAKAAGG